MKARYQTQTTQRLIKDLLTQRWLVLGATIGTLMQVSLTVYLPILIGDAVDVVLSPNSIQLLLPIIAKMIAVVGLNTLIQWVNPLIYNRLTFQFVYQLRQSHGKTQSNAHCLFGPQERWRPRQPRHDRF